MMSGDNGLLERYEDALLELIIEAAIEEDGLSALNLKSAYGSDIMIPNEATKHNIKTIHKAYSKLNVRKVYKVFKTILKLFLSIMISFALVFGVFQISDSRFEERIMNYVINILPQEFLPSPTPPEITVSWIPEGYELIDSGSSSSSQWMEYSHSSGNAFWIDFWKFSSGDVGIDTEDAEIHNLTINGYPSMVILKEILNQVVMTKEYPEQVAICCIGSENMEPDILLQIAQGIEF